ncbi:hypothetical protein [Snodgrassella alvi]|nr:hypothetical protein [Snodgrassella alvi]
MQARLYHFNGGLSKGSQERRFPRVAVCQPCLVHPQYWHVGGD